MPTETRSEFEANFIARVKRARKATGWNQREMAEALHVPLDNYETYERRSPLPHYLIAQFARVARVPIEYLFTGRMPRKAVPGSDRPSDGLVELAGPSTRRRKRARAVSDKMSETLL